MALKKNEITMSLAVLMIVLLAWMSRENLYNHSEETHGAAVSITAIDTTKRIAVQVDTSFGGLTIYYPITDSIGLKCFNPPSPDKDSSIIFCCAAAFTRYDKPHNNNHLNIAGDHVCSGVREQGYPCINNTGAFVFYNGKWKFLFDTYSHELDSAAIHHGCGFGQEMIIHKRKLCKAVRTDTDFHKYRALCEFNGRLCIIETKEATLFSNFKNILSEIGVSEAIYIDMGKYGYSWYREYADSNASVIMGTIQPSATNWLVFYSTETN